MDCVSAALDHLEVGSPIVATNLTMYPLLLQGEVAPSYLTLDEALASGLAIISEVSEAGSVPELRVENKATRPLLILDGEELVGAKQNRIVNLTILVPEQHTLHIPVSCVEAGRWAHRSRQFAAAGRTHYASGRARKLEQVSCAMRVDGSRSADQGAVWADIDEKARRLDAHSPTHAAEAMYERSRSALGDFEHRFEAVPLQAGGLFAINGAIAGMDLFDSQATWRKSMRKLVQSYGLDAVDPAGARSADSRTQPELFLAIVKRAAQERFPAIGLGEDVRISGETVAGGALAVDGKVIHLVAFPRGA